MQRFERSQLIAPDSSAARSSGYCMSCKGLWLSEGAEAPTSGGNSANIHTSLSRCSLTMRSNSIPPLQAGSRPEGAAFAEASLQAGELLRLQAQHSGSQPRACAQSFLDWRAASGLPSCSRPSLADRLWSANSLAWRTPLLCRQGQH